MKRYFQTQQKEEEKGLTLAKYSGSCLRLVSSANVPNGAEAVAPEETAAGFDASVEVDPDPDEPLPPTSFRNVNEAAAVCASVRAKAEPSSSIPRTGLPERYTW